MRCQQRNIVILVTLLLAGGCASFEPLPPRPADSDYRIQPDDSVEFILFPETPSEETSVTLVVQPDGPLVGGCRVAGRPDRQY